MSKQTRASRRANERTAKTARTSSRRDGAQQESAFARAIRTHPRIVLAAIVALNAMFALLTFLPQPHTGGDSANYLTLARSILQRHTYTDLYDPIQPPHTKYPPVFPMMLAIGMLVGLKTWAQLKLLMAAVGTVAVALTHRWIRRRGRPILSVLIPLLLIFSAGVLDQSHWLLSDAPFWMLATASLLAFERLPRRLSIRFAAGVATAVLAYFTRSAGLPLVLAVAAWLAWRRRWTQLGIFGAVLVPFAFLWWLRAHTTGGVEYTQEFWYIDPYMPQLGRIGIAQLMQRIAQNAGKYATIHIPILLASRTGSGITAISVVIVMAAVLGWVTRLRRAMVAELLMPLYIGLLLVWPAVWSGERFILPVFPLILYYAAVGGGWLMRRVGMTLRMAGGIGAAAVIVMLIFDVPPLTAAITQGRGCSAAYSRGEPYPCLSPADRSYFDAAIWSQKSLPDDAVVLSRKPRLFFEIAHGIRGTTYPMSKDPKAFFALADSVHARYVIYDRLTSLADYYLAPVLLQRPEAFCLIQQFGADGTMMFGIRPGASAMPDSPVAAADATFAQCDRSYYR